MKRIAGKAFLGLAALTMLYYIPTLLLSGVNSVGPMLMCIAIVCVPLTLGTALLAAAMPEEAARKRLVRKVLFVLFGFYVCALFAVLFFTRIDFSNYAAERQFYLGNQELMTNFVPLETIRLYIRCLIYDFIGVGIPLDNLMGNILLFMPMALFLPCLFPSLRKFWRFFLLMTAILMAVEALQFVLCCGSCDVDDVILNLSGTLIVYGLIRIPFINRLLKRLYLWQESAPLDGQVSTELFQNEPSQNEQTLNDQPSAEPSPAESALVAKSVPGAEKAVQTEPV